MAFSHGRRVNQITACLSSGMVGGPGFEPGASRSRITPRSVQAKAV